MNAESISGDVHVKALPPAGELACFPDFIETSRADELFATLMRDLAWRSRTITMFGKKMMQPRKIVFQGDPGISYAYSGGTYRAEPWHRDLMVLRDEIEQAAACRFNCVLGNLYRDGRDSMGWHSDDEAELGSHPTIASVSLGGVRRFVLRSRQDKRRRVEIQPAHGSLMIMRGDVQRCWQHALPKTARHVQARINLTFREVVRPPRPKGHPTP